MNCGFSDSTRDLAGLDAEGFIERVLLGALRTKQVVIGEGFRFGSGRGGDVELLRRAGATCGFDVQAVPPHPARRAPAVSSTRVREAIAAGRLDEAKALLGRDFRISGRVIEGQKLGPHARISHGEPAAAPPRVAGRGNLCA